MDDDKKPVNLSTNLILPQQSLPPNLFILPVNHSVVFPTLMAPLVVSIPKQMATVEEAINRQRFLGLLMTREKSVNEKTRSKDLHRVGIAVKIVKRLKLPDGSVNLLVSGISRFKVESFLSDRPHLVVKAKYLEDAVEKSKEMEALTRTVISSVKKLSEVNPFFTDELKLAMINAPGPGTVADLVAFALSLSKADAQAFLEIVDVKKRYEVLLQYLAQEQEVANLQVKIQEGLNNRVNTMQREFFLKEQLKSIKKELGMEEEGREKNSRDFKERIEEANMPEEAKKVALEELKKFETLSEQSPEYNVARNYLETLCGLPWNSETKDRFNLQQARKLLDRDHYGLKSVKDRIIEFLAVKKLAHERNPDQAKKGSIICLVGPPGVGKTSVGKSIAETLGRKFYRFSLGGMRDEAEIKGHRRTYIGAMPGKIIQALKRVESKNPVIMLDEIDKLGQSFQGDPASALLEVLDPEQNEKFLDHFVDVPFDLSNVVFVATANSASTIPAPLLDRMEVIELPGYTLEEKEKIAADYVVPKILKKHSLKSSEVKISKSALKLMMNDYAREPGLRSLQKLVEKIARKSAAKLMVSSRKGKKSIVVKKEDLRKWLGPQRFYNELAERITHPGTVVGLAWTSMGGDILFIEARDIPGSGQLKLTGQMGEVMTESASIAWTYVKKKLSEDFGFTPDYFKSRDFHLHIPAGAIPKDGPSAGITMTSALYSLMTGATAKQKIAMTGELSLVGKVLPVGGIKEKILAAKRSGINTVILPKLNKKDLTEVPKNVLKGMHFEWVDQVDQVLELVLSKPKKSVIAYGLKKNPSSAYQKNQLSQ